MAFYRPIAKQQGKRHCPVHPHDTQYRLVKTFTGSQQASVLLEIHIAQEEAKHGFSPDECRELLYSLLPEALPYIRICGLMGMATNTDDTSLIKNEFHNIHELFTELKNSVFKGDEYFCELSMGMSHDYPIAIREGSTMIRIGTSIFGEREY